MKKRIVMLHAAVMAAVLATAGMTAMADSPMVSNVTAKQRWPWNGLDNLPRQIRLQRGGESGAPVFHPSRMRRVELGGSGKGDEYKW